MWDQHGCLPLGRDSTIDGLADYLKAGVDFVSVNVGFDAVPWQEALHTLANFRRRLDADPDHFMPAESVDDVLVAKRTGRLAVAFDLEGAEALDGNLGMIEVYHRLGVRTMLIAYNRPNRAGGGCHGDPRDGLTRFGREVVREMNRIGMVVDASHCSYQTTMDLFGYSSAPVIFSHSAPAGICTHERNVSDEQMRACAATGGVIGINGVGIFLGDGQARTTALMRAIDYAVDIVGPSHVGLGLDHIVDRSELIAFFDQNQELFPGSQGYGPDMTIVAPAELGSLVQMLRAAGCTESEVRGIAGENFLRVARAVWTANSAGPGGVG